MHIGVVGLGYWGSKHLRVVSGLPEVDRVTVFDLDARRSAAAVSAFPAVGATRSFEELLPLVDAVILATHPSTHASLGLAALSAGRHVLVEKPLALNSRDAQMLVDAAESTGSTLMVGHTFVYNPAVQALRSMIDEGHLGEVLHIESQRLNLGLYQPDCDVIWDLAPHDLSILTTLLGRAPTSVSCWGRGHIDPAVVDNAYIRLGFSGLAAEAVIHVSWLDPHKTRQVTVVGSQRMAIYDDLADDLKLRVYDKSIQLTDEPAVNEQQVTYRYGDLYCPYIPPQEPLMLEDRHFVDCINTGRVPLTGGRAGLEVVRTLEAASVALRTGTEVLVTPLPAPPAPTVDRTAVVL